MARVIKIDFNPQLFTKVFWHISKAMSDVLIRFIWIYGGSSASKTFSTVQETIKLMLSGPNENTLVLRKFATDIKDSIYADFEGIIKDWGLEQEFIIQQNYIECRGTGSYVRFRGLDDSEKVKGITRFKRIILEEVSQFDEVDLKQIRKRLRGRIGQQIIGIFNPISEDHWIKKNIFDKMKLIEEACDIAGKWISESGNTVIIKTNYLDNGYIVGPYFTDQHAIDDFEEDKLNDNTYYQIYGLGNWGRLRTGGEFWKDFNPNKHVKANPFKDSNPSLYRPELPIHMSWDKNVNPYCPASLWQTETIEIGEEKIKRVWQFDEIAMEDPLNRVRHVCAEFKRRYPVSEVDSLFIYGDRTAWQEDTLKEKGENMYTDIEKELDDYNPRRRLPSANPSVNQSADFVNACYSRNYGGIELSIGDNCKKSIYDYTYALEDENGGLAKTTKKNPLTKVVYQEFGHFSDAKRYILVMLFSSDYIRFKTKGKPNRVDGGSNEDSNYSF